MGRNPTRNGRWVSCFNLTYEISDRLIEQGFEMLVVKDVTAAPRHTELGDGYKAALINFGYIANAVLSTDDVVAAMV